MWKTRARRGKPSAVFLPGKSQGQRSLQSMGSQRVRHDWSNLAHAVVSNTLQPHKLQHGRPPCPSPTPGVYLIHVHWVSDAIQPSHPLLSPSPPAIFPNVRVFSNESALHIRWPKYWSISISPSSEYQGWFPLGLTGLVVLEKLLRVPWTERDQTSQSHCIVCII